MGVEVVLFALLVDRNPFKNQIFREARLGGARSRASHALRRQLPFAPRAPLAAQADLAALLLAAAALAAEAAPADALPVVGGAPA